MKTFLQYVITAVVGLLISLGIMMGKDVFNQTDLKTIYHILSDSFFVSGVVIAGVGLLVFASNEGTFDGIAYGLKAFFNIFKKDPEKKFASFYDYKAAKAQYKAPISFLLIVGVCIIAIAVVMYILYANC